MLFDGKYFKTVCNYLCEKIKCTVVYNIMSNNVLPQYVGTKQHFFDFKPKTTDMQKLETIALICGYEIDYANNVICVSEKKE